jgi:hypothetical protein
MRPLAAGDADARSAKSTSRSSQSLAMSARVSAAFTTHVARPATAAAPILRAFLGHPRAHKPHGNDRVCGTCARPPRRRSSRPAIEAPRGTLLASARREPIEPAQWPPAPPFVGMLDFRWTRGAVEIG